jgi:hypothetical protein
MHLAYVATSHQHVVKPQFNGRIDFAIPFVDLAEQEFSLVSAWLDHPEGRKLKSVFRDLSRYTGNKKGPIYAHIRFCHNYAQA